MQNHWIWKMKVFFFSCICDVFLLKTENAMFFIFLPRPSSLTASFIITRRASRCLLQKLFTFLKITLCNARCGHFLIWKKWTFWRNYVSFYHQSFLSPCLSSPDSQVSSDVSVRVSTLNLLFQRMIPWKGTLQPSVTAPPGINTANECMNEYASE